MDESSSKRETYRHGDLQRALLEAGIELARAGGPDAVVLREATRQAGVVPNAAYRHFASRQELLLAVRAHALWAIGSAMKAELVKLKKNLPPKEYARGSLKAVGIGYLKFAHAEPGLFRTAFSVPVEGTQSAPTVDNLHPFALLGQALDRMVEADVLPADRRLGAEYLAWSAVHGLAVLFTDGPLRKLSAAQRLLVGQRLVEMVEKGL